MEQLNHIEVTENVIPLPLALTPSGLLNRALSQGATVEVMERLMALQERHNANEARKAFNNAIADAQAEIPVIRKNRSTGFDSKRTGERTQYDYEDLGEIIRIVKPILARHGLTPRFRTLNDERTVMVACIISHVDGHCEENELTAGLDISGSKNSLQALGSTVTYLERYTLKAALGLASSKDDDGHAATPADNGLITAAQAEHIKKLAAEVGADLAKFLAFYKLDKLSSILASDFNAAVAKLEEVRRRNAQRARGDRS